MLFRVAFIFLCFIYVETRSSYRRFDLNPEKLLQQAEALARQFRNISKGELKSVKEMQKIVVNFTAPVDERVKSVEEMLKTAESNPPTDPHVAAVLIVDIMENTRKELRTLGGSTGAEAELFLQVLIKTFLISLDEDFVHADEKNRKEMVLKIIEESKKHPEHY